MKLGEAGYTHGDGRPVVSLPMAREIHILPSADDATPRQVRAVSVGAALSLVVWIGLAVWVAVDVGRLEQLSTMAGLASHTLGSFARLLGGLGHLPLVGSGLADASTRLSKTGASLALSGRESRAGLQQLSILLGVAIAGLPILPLIVVFARLRTERRREANALTSALADPESRPRAVRYLAHRAMTNLPYRALFSRGRKGPLEHEQLARAELERLGLGHRWSQPGTVSDAPEPGSSAAGRRS